MSANSYRRNIVPTDAYVDRDLLPGLTEVLMDNRAIGYRGTTLGGKGSSFEAIAEVIVENQMVERLSRILQDTTIVSRAFDKVFPKKESLKLTASQGILTLPMLVDAYAFALRSGQLEDKDVKVLAHVMAEITVHAIRELNLVLPFDGVLYLSQHDQLFPDYQTLETATKVKRVTDILESLRFDPAIGRVKTLNAAALQLALAPAFSRAGQLLLQITQFDMYFKETFQLLRMFLSKSPELPKRLLNNNDLASMGNNLSYVLAALQLPPRAFELTLPEYELDRAITETTMALRETRRFSLKALAEIKSSFIHYTLRDVPGQRVVGVLFARNIEVANRPQVTIFTQIGRSESPLWTQTLFSPAEQRVEAVLAGVYERINCQQMAATLANVAAHLDNKTGPEFDPYVLLANGATELDLTVYAASIAPQVALSFNEDGTYKLLFLSEDKNTMNYDSRSAHFGTLVVSTDPAEAVIHSGLSENVGELRLPARIQGIPDEMRTNLLLESPESFTVSLAETFNLQLELDGFAISQEMNLRQLLGLPELALSVTKPITGPSLLMTHIEQMLSLARSANPTTTVGEICAQRAAMALVNLLHGITASPAGKALTRTVALQLIQSEKDRAARDALRGQVRNAAIMWKLGLQIAMCTLVALRHMTREQMVEILDLVTGTQVDRFMIGSQPLGGELL